MDDSTRVITSSEGHGLFVRAQQLNELNTYAEYPRGLHEFENELLHQREEDRTTAAVMFPPNPV